MPRDLTPEEIAALGIREAGPKDVVPDVVVPAQGTSGVAPSALRSGLLGAASGIPIIGGLMDEATGLTHAAYGKTFGDSKEPFWDVYRQERDLYRKEEDEAARENPKAFYGSGLASGLVSGGVLGPSGATLKALSVPAKYGLAAGTGGLDALTRSRDDLTKGEVVGAGRDAATGAALGVGAQYVGDKLAKLPSWLGDKLKAMADENKAKIAAAAADKAAKETASAMGVVGGETQKGSRILENLARQDAESPEVRKAALAALQSDAARELASGVKMGSMEKLPSQLGIIAKAKDEAAQLAASQAERASKYAEEEAAKGIMGNLSPRAKVMLSRAIPNTLGPVIGGAAGQFFGSPWLGTGIGILAGNALAATAGAPGTAMANMVRKPSFRLGVANLGMSATGALEGAFRKAAQGATPTLQASPLGKYLLDEEEAKDNFKKNGG